MNLTKKILFFFFFLNQVTFGNQHLPKLFLFIGADQASKYKDYLENPYVAGVQIIYAWKQLEPRKDFYDFSKIEKDLNFLNLMHKKIFVQLQDRSFNPDVFNVPDYIREEKKYHGGVAMQYDFPGEGKPIATGWVARVWDPLVRERFQLLIQKMAAQFDGKVYGINLPETSADFDYNNLPANFTSDKYFEAELKNIVALRKSFKQSIVIQYVNFFPNEWNNDHHYMQKIFSYAVKHQIALGGPDVIPFRESQMQNSYPFFNQLKGKLLTAMAIQEPDYTYKNPRTNDYYKFDEFYNFSKDYLGATILFWNVQEPFFSNELAPKLNGNHFEQTIFDISYAHCSA